MAAHWRQNTPPYNVPLSNVVRAVARSLELVRYGRHGRWDSRPRLALVVVMDVHMDGQSSREKCRSEIGVNGKHSIQYSKVN